MKKDQTSVLVNENVELPDSIDNIFTNPEEREEILEFLENTWDYAVALACLELQKNLSYAMDLMKNYQGSYSSFEHYAEELMLKTMEVPEKLKDYIDYESFASDLEHYYTVIEHGLGVYVFSN